MAGKSLEEIKKSLIATYRKDFPGEALYGKVFSIYIMERYAKLLYKIYQKAGKEK